MLEIGEQFEYISAVLFCVKAVRFFLCTVEYRSMIKLIFYTNLQIVIQRRSAKQMKVCDAKLQGL